jgi:hypothetical protein
MRRLARHLLTAFAALSLLLCICVAVLWVRGQSGADRAHWKYNRWQSDRSVASNEVELSFERRIGAIIHWGHAPPPAQKNYHLFYYYNSADQSGGLPRLRLSRRPYVPGEVNAAFQPTDYGDSVFTGWGPVRWLDQDRSMPRDGFYWRSLHLGISYWLVASLLLVLPILWMTRFLTARRAQRQGLCRTCGYDLRASSDLCPECGTAIVGN